MVAHWCIDRLLIDLDRWAFNVTHTATVECGGWGGGPRIIQQMDRPSSRNLCPS
jgi:hypothetical protein